MDDLAIFDLKESLWVTAGDPAGQRLLSRRMNARQAYKMRAPSYTRHPSTTATPAPSTTSTHLHNLMFSKSENNMVSVKGKERVTLPGEAGEDVSPGNKRVKRMIRPGEEDEEGMDEVRGSPGQAHPSPGPRYGHAMERYGQDFVLYGGKKDTGG